MKLRLSILFTVITSLVFGQIVPEYETFTLKNGLKVYLLQYGNIPAVNVQLTLNTGKANETPGQQNYAQLMAEAVLLGNAKYDAETQSNKSFALGTALSSSAGNDFTTVELNILSKDLDPGLDLISAAVLSPTFPKDKIDLLISQSSDFNSLSKMDIAELANVYSNYAIHGIENPLGRYFYKAQLQKVTPTTIKEYYEFNFTPKNANLIITGSFDKTAIKQLIEKYFGAWKSAFGSSSSVSLSNPTVKKREIAFVNRVNASQCALQWNKIAPAINEKDQLAFAIANSIFNDVLFKEIREKGGKTYSISSSYKASKFSNLFSIACSVRSSELKNTVDLFDKTLADFASKPIDEATFKAAVYQQIVNINRTESPDAIASFYNPLVYNFEKRKNRINELKALTLDEVNKVIKKYYTPNIYKLVIAGDETKVNEQLSQLKDLKKYSSSDLERDN